jgi:hypothetical protein
VRQSSRRVPRRDESQCDKPRLHRPSFTVPLIPVPTPTTFFRSGSQPILLEDILRFLPHFRTCPNISTPAVRNASPRMGKGPPVTQIRDCARQMVPLMILMTNFIGLSSGTPGRRQLHSRGLVFTGVCQAIAPAQETQDMGRRRRSNRSGIDLLQTLGPIQYNVRNERYSWRR